MSSHIVPCSSELSYYWVLLASSIKSVCTTSKAPSSFVAHTSFRTVSYNISSCHSYGRHVVLTPYGLKDILPSLGHRVDSVLSPATHRRNRKRGLLSTSCTWQLITTTLLHVFLRCANVCRQSPHSFTHFRTFVSTPRICWACTLVSTTLSDDILWFRHAAGR